MKKNGPVIFAHINLVYDMNYCRAENVKSLLHLLGTYGKYKFMKFDPNDLIDLVRKYFRIEFSKR